VTDWVLCRHVVTPRLWLSTAILENADFGIMTRTGTNDPERSVTNLARNVKEAAKPTFARSRVTILSRHTKTTFEGNFYWCASLVRKSFGATPIFHTGRVVEASNIEYRVRVGAAKTSDYARAT
jgi:hypothetical protein